MSPPAGRKKDLIWMDFNEMPVRAGVSGIRAKCKFCNTEIQGIVSRLKKHRELNCVVKSIERTNMVNIKYRVKYINKNSYT